MSDEHRSSRQGMHPAIRRSDRAASVLTSEQWDGALPPLSTTELMEFLEDFPGQLATVTMITPAPNRRWQRVKSAIGRGCHYFFHSLEDLTDIYDR